MTPQDIKYTFEQRFLNVEMSMNLEPDHHKLIDNDNGILYLVIFFYLLTKFSPLTDSEIALGQRALSCIRESDGNFVRSKIDRPDRLNSHDNYDAIAAMQPLGIADSATEICTLGDTNGWTFPVKADDSLSFKALRQPGTIAYTQICANRKPYLLNLAALVVGILINSFQFARHTRHICWMRVQALRIVAMKHIRDADWQHIVWPILAVCAFYDLMSWLKTRNLYCSIVSYYSCPFHPNVLLSRLLNGEAI